jgi:signal transduction histidine kinase
VSRARVADYVRRHASEIGREWTEGTRARVPAYRRMPEATLLRNMRWNAKVVAHLIGTGHYPRGSRYIAWLAEIRLRYQFAIGDVIRAILLSRDLLCARLGTPEGCELTSRAMERLLVDFAARFHALQLREKMQGSAELVRMQEQIKRHELERQVEQAEKLASIGQLTAGLAHEIGTPLNIISGNAEYALMHMAETDPRRAELKGIIRETDRIAGLIRRLLDYARPKPLMVEPLDLNALVRDTAGVLARQAENAGVRMRLDLDEKLPPVPGDRGQLEQVLINLGLNAIQAMPQGGTLTLGTRRTNRRTRGGPSRPMAAVVAADTGVGIPAKDRAEIFRPFFSTKPAGEGTGLGLAVCQRIVSDHGGDIRVRSRPGRGTTFTVRLPFGGERARG